MLDRKEEGDPPTKFRPPRINFEPKSGSERGRERKVCENKGAKGFRGNIRKLEKRFRRNFERKESNDNNNNSGDAKSLPVSSVSRREKNYGYTGGRTRV